MSDECDGPFTKEDYNRLLYNVAASNNETWALRHDPRGDFLVEIYVAARVAFNKLCQTGEWDHYGAPPQVIYALWGGLKEHYGEETSNRLLVPMKAAWKREGWEWDDWKKETENPFTKSTRDGCRRTTRERWSTGERAGGTGDHRGVPREPNHRGAVRRRGAGEGE